MIVLSVQRINVLRLLESVVYRGERNRNSGCMDWNISCSDRGNVFDGIYRMFVGTFDSGIG